MCVREASAWEWRWGRDLSDGEVDEHRVVLQGGRGVLERGPVLLHLRAPCLSQGEPGRIGGGIGSTAALAQP